MKGYILWLFILLAVSFVFYYLLDTPSYILISFKSYTIETTLLSFIFCAILSFAAWRIIYSFILFFLKTIPSYYKNIADDQTHIFNKFNQAIICTFLGDWHKAYKYFNYAYTMEQSNFIYLISASVLASKTQNYSEAKNLLTNCTNMYTTDKYYDVIDILLTKLYIKQQQYKQAHAILIKLNEKYPANMVVLPMLMDTLIYLKHWNSLFKLLPEIKKTNIITTTKYLELEYQLILEIFKQNSEQTNDKQNLQQNIMLDKLNQSWKQLTKVCQTNPIYISIYVKALIKINCNQLAESILETNLAKGLYNLQLINIYSNLQVSNYATQLKLLEQLQTEFTNCYQLMFFLGKASLNNKLLGKAYSYFSKSIAIKKNALAYKGIADVCLLENKPEQAIKYFNLAFSYTELGV